MWNQGDLYLNDISWGQTLEVEGYLRISSNLSVFTMKDGEEEERTSAGYIDVRVFDERWGNILYAADVDGDAFAAMETYMDGDKEYERIAVLNRIHIEEKFRGKGIASYVIDQLHHYLKEVMDVQIIVLIASPGVRVEKEEEKTRKLVEFYSQFGYTPITEEHDNHLWLDLFGDDNELAGASLSMPKSEIEFWDRFFHYAKDEAILLKDTIGSLEGKSEILLDETIEVYGSNIKFLDMIKDEGRETVTMPLSLLELALISCDLATFVDEIKEDIVDDAPELTQAEHYRDIIKELCESDEYEAIISALIGEYKIELFE